MKTLTVTTLFMATIVVASANFVCDISSCKVRESSDCTASVGAFQRPTFLSMAEDLIVKHFSASMTILKMAARFGEVNVNRQGFYEYYNKLADDLWEDGMKLLDEFTKRGGQLRGLKIEPRKVEDLRGKSEVRTLALALEEEKKLWDLTQQLIHKATSFGGEEVENKAVRRDAHFAHFLTDDVASKHVERIKHLSNHVNTITELLREGDQELAVHLYDTEFLK